MIEKVWLAIFGEDITTKRLTGPRQHRVLCPFHRDSHASCDVSIAKDAFFCRSCGAQGGYLALVMLEGLAKTKHEAMLWVKRRGIATGEAR